MSADVPDAPGASPEPKRPFYKDPFVIAFAIGVVLLTGYRIFEGGLYRAAPPIRDLPSWSLSTFDGGTVSSSSLAGHVVMVEFVAAPCDAACLKRVDTFGLELSQTEDLKDAVHLVSVVMPGALSVESHVHGTRWHAVTGNDEQLRSLLVPLREGLESFSVADARRAVVARRTSLTATDAGSTLDDFSRFTGIAVIDQRNVLRDFWEDSDEGRGNAVGAARLLAKHPEAAQVH